MSLPRDSKRFPGMQADQYAYDRNAKPITQPPCDRPDQHQFGSAIEGQYIDVTGDRWNNEIPQDWSNHNEATPGMGMSGDRQFSSNRADLASTGYGANLGLNVIEYGQGAAFNRADSVTLDVSRADRGKGE
jgi:hypothetical protein